MTLLAISSIESPFSVFGCAVFIVGGFALLWRAFARLRSGESAWKAERARDALRRRGARALTGWPVPPSTEIFVGLCAIVLPALWLTR